MDPDSKRLRVSVTDGSGRRIRDGGLGRWLESVAPARARGQVGVALVSDAHIRALNRQYLHQDRPTDVLAFPADGTQAPSPEPRVPSPEPRVPSPEPRLLGDIAIATGVARRQARAAGHAEQAELRVLALHGLLHLVGYDHDDPSDRGRMARAEARLLRKGGLTAGVVRRATGRPAGRRTGE